MTELRTFRLPASIDGTRMDVEMGKQMILAWRLDRRFQLELAAPLQRQLHAVLEAGRRFFALAPSRKSRYVSDLSYSGYFAPGEVHAEGRPDPAERFVIGRDIPLGDPRVQAQWPCHGPVPWPDPALAATSDAAMGALGGVGARLLRLLALGLELHDLDALVRLTGDGWHHLSLVRPASGDAGPAQGGDSGCGMLVLAAAPELRVLTVTAGDSLQFLTGGYIPSTPPGSRAASAAGASPALRYDHEPNFQATLDPLAGGDGTRLHYGSHFTTTRMRRHPERLTTWRILAEGRLAVLGHLSGSRRAA